MCLKLVVIGARFVFRFVRLRYQCCVSCFVSIFFRVSFRVVSGVYEVHVGEVRFVFRLVF